MILISHRGNIDGPNPSKENHPDYIKEALNKGYDVEIDVWYTNNGLMMGHDCPQYEFDPYTLFVYYGKSTWWHCKNLEAVNYFQNSYVYLNYFWHENDTVTLTSQNYIWAYPGNQPIENSIAVMPEINDDNVLQCAGICSDYIINYKK